MDNFSKIEITKNNLGKTILILRDFEDDGTIASQTNPVSARVIAESYKTSDIRLVARCMKDVSPYAITITDKTKGIKV